MRRDDTSVRHVVRQLQGREALQLDRHGMRRDCRTGPEWLEHVLRVAPARHRLWEVYRAP